MSRRHYRPRDELGWRIPREGCSSRMLYDLMRQGGLIDVAGIAKQLNCSPISVRVKMHRIRHPRPRIVQAGAKLVARGKLKTKTRKPPLPRDRRSSLYLNSRYVIKLVTILGMSVEEAQRIERELIEKENNKANEERTPCQRVANATSAS